ncbi:MAG: DUF5655 domain-containing protein [Flavobacteriales bacterium]
MEDKMIANLEEQTGKKFSELIEIARKSGLEKHGQIVSHLKETLGIGHGQANLIAHRLKQSDAGSQTEKDLVSEQYQHRQNLKTIYDSLEKHIKGFGADVEIAPKLKSVSFRRKRQFALIQPTTKTRVDLGLKFDNRPIGGRLESSGPFGAMCTHRIQLTDASQVDAELIQLIREAYEEG